LGFTSTRRKLELDTEEAQLERAAVADGSRHIHAIVAPLRDYVRVVLADLGVEIETLFDPVAPYLVSIDGQLVDGPESRLR
jgi:hypothetical protein